MWFQGPPADGRCSGAEFMLLRCVCIGFCRGGKKVIHVELQLDQYEHRALPCVGLDPLGTCTLPSFKLLCPQLPNGPRFTDSCAPFSGNSKPIGYCFLARYHAQRQDRLFHGSPSVGRKHRRISTFRPAAALVPEYAPSSPPTHLVIPN